MLKVFIIRYIWKFFFCVEVFYRYIRYEMDRWIEYFIVFLFVLFVGSYNEFLYFLALYVFFCDLALFFRYSFGFYFSSRGGL